MQLVLNESELKELIKEPIYIVGAGDTANTLLKRLERYGYKWSKIISSNGNETIRGEKVQSIRDTADEIRKSNSTVIVATNEKYHGEINETLNSLGISGALFISDRLNREMNKINSLYFSFVVHLVEHCNLKCRGCYHFSSLAKETYLDLDEYTRDVTQLSMLFDGKINEIWLMGGEPLLHPQIADFFEISRRYFKNTTIKILTNGIKLLDMDENFWTSMADNSVELWVTKYPISFDYDKAEIVASNHGVKLNYYSEEPVRTLGYQPINLDGKQDYKSNYNSCYRANDCVDLKHGKIFPCIIPAEIGTFDEYFNEEHKICEQDYVDIYSVNSGMELLELMARPMPFCRYCNRENTQIFGKIPWSQTNYDINEWM